MRKYFFSLIFCFFISVHYSQQPSWQWIKSATNNGSSAQGNKICIDGQGNVYQAGVFWSYNIVFGSFTLTNQSASGTSDIFVVKYDPAGNVIWAKNFGGMGTEWVNDICVDGSNNCYFTGNFSSSSTSFASYTLTNQGSQDFYIAKLDPQGQVVFAKCGGGPSADGSYAIDVDNNGVIIAGAFSSSLITVDSYTLANFASNLVSDYFIVKYDLQGNIVWAQKNGGNWGDGANDLSCDGLGNIYVVGAFMSGQITFGSYTFTISQTVGGHDFFILKYNSTGTVLWAKKFGNGVWDDCTNIKVDSNGDIYIAGITLSDTLILGADTLKNPGHLKTNFFVSKLNAAGNFLWTRSGFGKYNKLYTTELFVDPVANIYLSGQFTSDSITIGTNLFLNSDQVQNQNKHDFFLVKYDAAGNQNWQFAAGTAASADGGIGLAADATGNFYLSGYSEYGFQLGAQTFSATGSIWTSFLAKYGPPSITGINTTIKSEQFEIFPNPLTETGTYRFSHAAKRKIIFFNARGVEMLSILTTKKEENFSVPPLPAGIYFIRIEGNEHSPPAVKIIIR